MVKILLDAGHGGSDPGAISGNLKEKNITLKIAKNIESIIKSRKLNASIKMSRTKDTTVSLTKRVQKANDWQADLFLSIHVNSGGGTGYEDFIHRSLSNQSKTARLRHILHDEIIKHYELRNRGKKKANFQVLRETRMPAILTENGFIDHPKDRELLQNNAWLKSLSEGYVNGLIKAFNLSSSINNPGTNETMYRVVVGSFTHKQNAKIQVNQLEKSGYDSFIDQVTINNMTQYRVIVGSFARKKNAQKQKERLKNSGFASFILPFKI